MTATAPRVLSFIPPMTQLNTPYPSTAYITGFLRSREVNAVQEDLALALVLKLLSKEGLERIIDLVQAQFDENPERMFSPAVQSFMGQRDRYTATINRVIAFLQGKDSTVSHRIVSRSWLPEGPRFDALEHYMDDGSGDPIGWAFGALGQQDRAKHYATLYLNDLADVIRDAADPRFEFVRYAESLSGNQPTFDPLASALAAAPTLVDEALIDLTRKAIWRHRPTVVLLSTPFPGSVYAAFRIAQTIKAEFPHIKLILGGGFVNTELRELDEPRVFDYFDFVTLDAGERPLLALLEHLQGERGQSRLVRTFVRDAETGKVKYINMMEADIAFAEVGTPTWDGLPLHDYLSLLDMLNPMHRMWSDGRWNKLTIAHGCYWKKCSFCDVSLDYISRYEG
ncbi:MAG: radical SAM protein, partial [Comamonas sp.]